MALSKTTQFIGFIGWLLLSFIVAVIGAVASIEAGAFYGQLTQPVWAPPASVFSPVWTTLYVVMAISAWLVWRKNGFKAARLALSLFIIQLVFNALWSWLFFAWHLGAWSVVNIVLLWGLIVATLIHFWRVNPLAGVLLIPYLLWVSFAVVLNYAIWQLNPILLG